MSDLDRLFSREEEEKVKAAVNAAEGKTAGEIVPYVVAASDSYEGALWKSAALGALAAPLAWGILEWRLELWGGPLALVAGGVLRWAVPALVGAAVAYGAAVVLPVLRRWLIPAEVMDRRARRRAAVAFLEEEIFRTEKRTGILIFLSLFERRVVVMGDEGINRRVDAEEWQEVVDGMVEGIRRNRSVEALIAAIGQCGVLLERRGVEIQPDDENELSDELRSRRIRVKGYSIRQSCRLCFAGWARRIKFSVTLIRPVGGLALIAGLSAFWVATTVAGLEVPYLSGRVNDYAGMIDADAEARIVAKLESFETESGSQIAVLTIDTLAGDALEEFSHRVAETWALGREKTDDGVLLLVVRDDRKMRIEVGYGLEADLTDAESGRILRNVLRPSFRDGRFSQGIEEGVDTILATLEGAEVPAPEQSQFSGQTMDLPGRVFAGLIFLAVMGPFSLSALFGKGCSGWFLYVFLMPFWATFPSVLVHPRVGIGLLVGWIVFFPIFKLLLGRTAVGKNWTERHPGWTTWSSGGGGGFSGGGSSSGGFSGGGGSFGGGGASGSW